MSWLSKLLRPKLFRRTPAPDQNPDSIDTLLKLVADAQTAGAETSEHLAQALSEAGLKALGNGRPAHAARALTEADRFGFRAPELHYNIALALSRSGQSEAAAEAFARAQSDGPRDRAADSFALRNAYACAGLSLSDYRQMAENWAVHHVPQSPPRPPVSARGSHQPLKVGLLSGRFHRHAVGFLAVGALEHIDPDRLELHLFNNSRLSDDYTERFKAIAASWHDIRALEDDAAAQLIRNQSLDLLIDMGGHSAGGRLGVVMQRPAPVQAKWAGGQHGTTGVPALDYFVSDAISTPPAHDAFFTEAVIRLPHSYACYAPPPDAPPVTPLPAQEHDKVTFGCFNNIAKISAQTKEMWAAILHQVPSSRLVLKHAALNEGETRDRVRAEFAAYGVTPDQLILREPTGHQTHLGAYSDIDISLDPVPWNGCVTTCESLWMGVPVVTLPGEAFCHRHSASFLSTAGLTDWIAGSSEDYVAKAVAAANNLNRLSELRANLRSQLAASPLCDGEAFAQAFVDTCRRMVETEVG